MKTKANRQTVGQVDRAEVKEFIAPQLLVFSFILTFLNEAKLVSIQRYYILIKTDVQNISHLFNLLLCQIRLY